MYKAQLADRSILSITGSDHLNLLQGVVTQDLEKLENATAVYSCLLTPQGKLIADFFIIKQSHGVLIDCHTDISATLIKKMAMYKLRADVKIENVKDQWEVFTLWNEVDITEEISSTDMDATVFFDPRWDKIGLRALIKTDIVARGNSLADFQSISEAAYQRHLRRLGIPQYSIDMSTEQVFPLDANLDVLHGIDYAKGCFVGQEVASRMKRKGEIRKRIMTVEVQNASSTETWPAGTKLKRGEITLGEITSGEGSFGLALIRLDRLQKTDGPILMENGVVAKLNFPQYLEREASQ